MIAALVLTLLIPVLLIYCYKNAYKRPKNFPPGPPSLPLYGAYWIILAHGFNDLADAFRKLGEKYRTKIIGCTLGPVHSVVINDPQLMKEMLNREEFDGRMDIILFRLRSFWKKLGIFFTDGYFWHVQRRFSLRYLRDYGFGRRDSTLETTIEHEIKEMLDMRLNGSKYPAEKLRTLPLYGAYWIILAHGFNDLADAFRKLGEKYRTKIIGCTLGPVHSVVINDPQLMKEMLNREEFDGRMDIILFRLRSFWKKLGIFFTDGYFWHVQRRFSLRYLRDYGFGRRDSTLETTIEHEIKEMLDMRLNGSKYPAEKEIVNGDLVYLPEFFTIPFVNGMVQILSRSTLPRSEYKELWSLARGTLMFQRSSNDMGGALSLTPWIKDILPNYSGYNGLVKGNQYLLDFFQKLIKEAIDTHDVTYDRHFIDMYLTKMVEEKHEKARTTYSVDQLILTCTDYMFPAATAVEFVLTILVERLLLQPDIQDKIHEEIDRVVGRDRFPNLDDRQNMPYIEACIRECMRYDTVVPLSVPHRAMKDTTIGGYDIPEDTMLSPNLTMLHMDKALWGDPENFRPERFIKDGKLDLASDKSLPFGAGRRLCAGETYARQSMFQVFAAFMQTFKVSTANGKPLEKPAKRIQGIITTIPEFWVRLTPRT